MEIIAFNFYKTRTCPLNLFLLVKKYPWIQYSFLSFFFPFEFKKYCYIQYYAFFVHPIHIKNKAFFYPWIFLFFFFCLGLKTETVLIGRLRLFRGRKIQSQEEFQWFSVLKWKKLNVFDVFLKTLKGFPGCWFSFFLPAKEQRLKLNHIIAAKNAIYVWLKQRSWCNSLDGQCLS